MICYATKAFCTYVCSIAVAKMQLLQLAIETQVQGTLMERVKGIEPSSSAWKAVALPLSYTRIRNQWSVVRGLPLALQFFPPDR
jgi:hypothetical protein